jgi:hypothetical protein
VKALFGIFRSAACWFFQLIRFADPDALALVESFGKAIYVAPG